VAPTPRRRYSRIPVGFIEHLPESISQTKPSALMLLLWLLISPLRRTLPGVVSAGELALADGLGWSVAALRRCLGELETANLVLVDREARVIFVRSAIDDDPPRNENTLKAWAADLGELRPGRAVSEIKATVSRVVTTLDQAEKLAIKWSGLTNSSLNSLDDSSPNGSTNSRGTPYPSPVPSPSPDPPPQPSADRLQPYLEAFQRLGAPFDYAAAAARLSVNQKERLLGIDLQSDLGPALQGLRTSFLAGDRARARPTLHDVIAKASLRQDLREGKHEEVGRQWTCALCALSHPIVDCCPPECEDCHRQHDADHVCVSRRLRLDREAAEADRRAADEREKAEAEAQGLTVEALIAKREEAQREQRRAWLADFKAKQRPTEAA